jgi:hypothetical protein
MMRKTMPLYSLFLNILLSPLFPLFPPLLSTLFLKACCRYLDACRHRDRPPEEDNSKMNAPFTVRDGETRAPERKTTFFAAPSPWFYKGSAEYCAQKRESSKDDEEEEEEEEEKERGVIIIK